MGASTLVDLGLDHDFLGLGGSIPTVRASLLGVVGRPWTSTDSTRLGARSLAGYILTPFWIILETLSATAAR
jgi:hypothetical protein